MRNNFLYADGVYEGTEDFDKGSFVSASGEKALLDKMEVSLSSIQLGRCVKYVFLIVKFDVFPCQYVFCEFDAPYHIINFLATNMSFVNSMLLTIS